MICGVLFISIDLLECCNENGPKRESHEPSSPVQDCE